MAFVTLYALEMRDATPRPRGRCAWQGYRPPRDFGPASSGAFLDAPPLDPAPRQARHDHAHERKQATKWGYQLRRPDHNPGVSAARIMATFRNSSAIAAYQRGFAWE